MGKDSGFILLNLFTVASSYRKHPPLPPGTAWDIYLKEESLSRARGDNLAEKTISNFRSSWVSQEK